VRQTSNTSKYFVVGRLRTGVRALPPPRLWKYWKFGCLCEHAVDHPFGLGALCASVVCLGWPTSLSVGYAQECAPSLRLVFGSIGSLAVCVSTLLIILLDGSHFVLPSFLGATSLWVVSHRSARPLSASSLEVLEAWLCVSTLLIILLDGAHFVLPSFLGATSLSVGYAQECSALPPPRLWKYWKFGCVCEHAVDHPFGRAALCASIVCFGWPTSLSVGYAQECSALPPPCSQ
jgi:hypothetical protein